MTGRASKAVSAAVAAVIGFDELAVVLALVVLLPGLWPRFGRESLIVPGIILLWMFLPSRSPFITRPPAGDKAERKKR